MSRKLALWFGIVTMSGCATQYQYDPAPDAPTAIFRNGSKFAQVIKLGPNPCPTETIDLDKPQLIPASKRLYVATSASIPVGTGIGKCAVTLSFIPKSHTDYYLLYRNGLARCMVVIGSKGATGELQIEPIRLETTQAC
jgi:hypothetical protein